MPCDKISYPTRQLAIDSINGIHKRFSRAKKKPVQAYQCSECNGWHITSCKSKPHPPKSQTKTFHSSKREDKNIFLRITDFTKLGSKNTMARFYALLIPLSVLTVESASCFPDTRVSKETTYQVEFHNIHYTAHTETMPTLDVELPAEFVLDHPELGHRKPLQDLIEGRASKGYLCKVRGPPDSCIQKSA
jgi:hypothetical protein